MSAAAQPKPWRHRSIQPLPAFPLWDVADVPALVGSVLEKALIRVQWITDEDYEDARSYLIEITLKLAQRYDPALDGANPQFGSWAAHILDMRVWSWYRTRFRDSRYVRCIHCGAREIEWKKDPCPKAAEHERIIEVPLAAYVAVEVGNGDEPGRPYRLSRLREEADGSWEREQDDILTRVMLNDSMLP